MLWAENVPPRVAAKFYIAVVQAMLLYDSETWVLLATALASLKGFHIHAAYRMAVRHKPRMGTFQVPILCTCTVRRHMSHVNERFIHLIGI